MNKIKNNNFRLLTIFILLLQFGCSNTIKLPIMQAGEINSNQKLQISNYDAYVQIKRDKDEDSYLCSLSLKKIGSEQSITKIKATMDIKKYPIGSDPHPRHFHSKYNMQNNITPIFDAANSVFNFKYILDSEGKYELKISISSINDEEYENSYKVTITQLVEN